MLRRAFVALLLAVPLVSTGGTAQAAGCTQVTVVVQYLNGGQDVRCTDGDPSSGLDALNKAGFGYTFHPRNPGFVCRVKNLPAAGQDCMKPKYWSYWHAPSPTGPWTYSSEGAGTYNPAPGSVEGWRFDCGAAPGGPSKCATSSHKPTPKPAPTPKPKTQKPTPAPTHTSSSRPSAGSSAKAGSGTSPSAAAKTKKAAAKAKAKATHAKKQAKKKAKQAAATAASASATPSPDSEIANASASQSAPPATSEPARRGTLPWWLGVVALVLIGGTAGAVTVVRRR